MPAGSQSAHSMRTLRVLLNVVTAIMRQRGAMRSAPSRRITSPLR